MSQVTFLVFFVGAFVRSCLPVYWCSRIDRTCDRQFMSRKICSTDHYDHHWFINLWWWSADSLYSLLFTLSHLICSKKQILPAAVLAAISAGCWTWSMSGPGSPSVQNVIAMIVLEHHLRLRLFPSLLTANRNVF